ncbi:hypothetical protein KIW84_045635, partial [Lathyrus oleraceus]
TTHFLSTFHLFFSNPIMNKIKQLLARISNSGNNNNNKKLILTLFTTVLIITAIVAIIATTTTTKNSNKTNKITSSSLSLSHHSHTIIKSACTTTLYPELCFSAISSEPNITHKITNHKDVISVSLNITKRAVEHNFFTVENLLTLKNLTGREKIALHDCLETIDETLDELKEAEEDLVLYPAKKTVYQHADDLKTLISAAITNQVTCLDGFSHDGADKRVRKVLEEGQVHVEHMCSNALAMTKNMTDSDIAEFEQKNMLKSERNGRKLLEEENGVKWPEWISAGDRRLLQGGAVKADVVVAADGSGNFKTVSEAVAAAPLKSSKRFVIKIKSGVYKENVEVPKKKINIMFLGDGKTSTIISSDRNVVDGSTTFHSATVAIVGANFLARDITFQNTAGPAKHQAVALRVGADLSAFYNCDVIAYQDTLYVHNNRQFFVNCFISGTVDFIFGNAAVVFQNCDIHARRPNSGQKNMVTAQGRVDPNQNTGIVIQKCRIGATKDLEGVKSSFPTYLGRPWKEYSRTVIMQSVISDVIEPVGWHEWNGNFALDTLIKSGVYKENVEVPKKKINIMFLGDGKTSTIISGDRNVVDGSTTFHSATVAIVGANFLARDITFQNTAGPAKHQAVALRVGADLSAFYNCDVIAYQDTLYVHNNRQFFVNCFISGTVDFIFGNAAVVFQNCDIHARRPNSGQKNMVTAQGRVDPNQNTGIVIQKCRIGATKDLEGVKSSFPTYLGRPWKEYSRTVIMQSVISDVIEPVGWHEWNGNFALDTLVYREYLNTGPGSGTSKRVTWKGFKVISNVAEAQSFTAGNFIGGSSWLGSTGFPFSLGL